MKWTKWLMFAVPVLAAAAVLSGCASYDNNYLRPEDFAAYLERDGVKVDGTRPLPGDPFRATSGCAIMIDGNATGEVMFYGKGAGKLATASAVVADMLDSIEHKDNRRRIFWGDGSKHLLRPLDTLQSAWYVRFKGAQKDVEELLPVESLTEPAEGVFVVQTRKLSTAEMNAAAEKLNARGEVRAAMRIL